MKLKKLLCKIGIHEIAFEEINGFTTHQVKKCRRCGLIFSISEIPNEKKGPSSDELVKKITDDFAALMSGCMELMKKDVSDKLAESEKEKGRPN